MIRIFIAILVGGLLGFAVGYFGRCASGFCPLTSNPSISALIGALFGLMISLRK